MTASTINGTILGIVSATTLRLTLLAMDGVTVVNFSDGTTQQTNADATTTISEVVNNTGSNYHFTTTVFSSNLTPLILVVRDDADASILESITVDANDIGVLTGVFPANPDADNLITINYATDVTIDLPGTGTAVIGAQDIWFTVKRNATDLDSESIIKVSSINGLEIINQDAPIVPVTSADGTLVVDGNLIPSVRVTVSAEAMATLLSFADNRYVWNLKATSASGADVSIKTGKLDLSIIATHDIT